MPRLYERAAVATAVAFAAMYAAISLTRHWHFGSSADLGAFDQAIWRMSRFEVPGSTVSGYANILGDHFYPILALLAPLYWIAPAPETLLITQAILLGASIVPVFAFTRARLTFGLTLALCVAYGFFWGLQRTALYDFHEMAFAPLLVATALLAIDRRRYGLLWTAAVGLMLVKEDLIPLVAMFGVFLMLRGERRHGVVMLFAALLTFTVVLWILIPWLSGSGHWATGTAFEDVFSRPWTVPAVLVTPPGKLVTLLAWLGPFLFLPLLSPYGWLLAPVMMERLLSSDSRHFGTGFHYSAPLAPILAMSAADGLARLRARIGPGRQWIAATLVTISVLACAVVPGHQPALRLVRASLYRPRPYQATALRALAVIPPDAAVVAQSPLVPRLSQRPEIYILKPGAPRADYLIAANDLDPWPNASIDEVRSLVDEHRRLGYQTVFDDSGWIVLKRP